MIETSVLAVIAAAFLVGGIVKGLSGIGMPLVALPILSFAVNVPTAVALTMGPILITNGYQALSGRRLLAVVRRFWPMQLTLAATLVVSTSLLTRIDNNILLIVTGAILSGSVLAMICAGDWTIPQGLERPIGVVVGLLAGAIGGVSSLFGIPIIIYMTSLGLERADFLASISVIYFFATIPYVASLLAIGAVPPALMLVSALAVIPAMIGMTMAGHFAQRLDEARFRRLLNWMLIALGLIMIARGVANA